MTNSPRHFYVAAIARNYVRLPGTPRAASRQDRRLAADLHDRGVPLAAVYAAFVLATVRRVTRSAHQPRLPDIRTLAYFLGAVDEVLDDPPDPDYIRYLAAKIKPFLVAKRSTPTDGHFSAVSRGR